MSDFAAPTTAPPVQLLFAGTTAASYWPLDVVTTSTWICHGRNLVLVDAGHGAALRADQAQLPLRDTRFMVLTHLHQDHVFGLPEMLKRLDRARDGMEPLRILVRLPAGAPLSEWWLRRTCAAHNVVLVNVDPGHVEKLGGLSLQTLHADHSLPTMGLLITGQGPGIVYSADTRPTESIAQHVPGRVLCHEASYNDSAGHLPLAVRDMHSTAREAADLAARQGARQLVLMHRAPWRQPAHETLREAQEICPGAWLAHDLEVLTVGSDGAVDLRPIHGLAEAGLPLFAGTRTHSIPQRWPGQPGYGDAGRPDYRAGVRQYWEGRSTRSSTAQEAGPATRRPRALPGLSGI